MRILGPITWVSAFVVIVVGAILLSGAWYAQEKYTSRSEFCGGSCHTMTEQFTAWKNSTHHASNNPAGAQAECIDCHFLPGEKHGVKAKLEGLRHLAAYLYNPDAPLPIRPVIKDGSCLSSGCHSVAEFENTEIQFTERARFIHKPHLLEGALEGQTLTCDTCHFKVTEEEHFEVPAEICSLCHLKLEKPTLEVVENTELVMDGELVSAIASQDRPSINFNEGLSKCSNCHTIPTKSLQDQLSADDSNVKAITHQTIQEASVPCESCHFEVVSGHGEVNVGNVVSNGCLTCHNRSDALTASAEDGKLMHDSHVATRTADCFDCHSVIEHKNRQDHLDFVREDCALCHQDQHSFQKILLQGTPVIEGISAQPHLMFNVNVNCMGCHRQKEVVNGHEVRTGAPETCASCHTPEHEAMLERWQEQTISEVADASEFELEVLEVLEEARQSGVAQDVITEAESMIKTGQILLKIVSVGNGVHNKKYAITIIDEVFGYFEDALDLLEGG